MLKNLRLKFNHLGKLKKRNKLLNIFIKRIFKKTNIKTSKKFKIKKHPENPVIHKK
jgi:hypothetical protein